MSLHVTCFLLFWWQLHCDYSFGFPSYFDGENSYVYHDSKLDKIYFNNFNNFAICCVWIWKRPFWHIICKEVITMMYDEYIFFPLLCILLCCQEKLENITKSEKLFLLNLESVWSYIRPDVGCLINRYEKLKKWLCGSDFCGIHRFCNQPHKPPITLAPEDLTPSSSLQRYLRSCACIPIQTRVNM